MSKQVKVLLVDDSQVQLKECKQYLEQQQEVEEVRIANNGIDAYEILEKERIDVVIMDLILPKMDGFGILERLSTRNDMDKPEIMVLSALSQESVVKRACEMGVEYYMIKPFSPQMLHKRIIELNNLKIPEVRRIVRTVQKPTIGEKSRDEKITGVFLTIGIPAHIKGYHYLREAIKVVMDNEDVINRITKELYPRVAKRFNATPSKVERAIRHAIEVAWARGRIENINGMFGYNIYGKNDKPTNGEFIALVADKLKLEQIA